MMMALHTGMAASYTTHEKQQLLQLLTQCRINFDNPFGNTWRLDRNGESTDVRVNGPFCANNADVLCEAAGAGLGIALLPLFIAHDALRAGTLVTVLDDYHAPRIYLSLVYAPGRNMSRKIRLFVKFMQQWFTLSDF